MHLTGESINILHVDDEPDFADTVATFLEREDDRFDIETATSASEGLDRLTCDEFDCVVSDYDMPGKTGIEFLKTIREEYPDLPFILFTGKGSEKIASDAISAGVTDYLQKETDSSQYVVLAHRIANAVEQHRANRRAEQLEQEYRLVAECATDGFWTLNPDTGELRMTGLDHFGYDEYEPTREWWAKRLHPEDRDRILERDDAMLADEDGVFDERYADRGWFTNEFRWQQADGTYAHCVERGVVIFEDGDPIKMIGATTDITDRKRREQELERVRERMEFALEFSDIIVWDWNVDANEATFYPSEQSLYGRSVETWEDFIELVHPDDRQTVRKAIDRALETGDPKYEEVRILHGDEVRWIEAPGKPVADGSGGTRMIGIARDITERKEREQQLQEERAFNKIALASVIEFYWVLDLDGHVVDWSDDDGSITGYTPEEAIGMHATEFFPEREHEYIEDKITELRETGDVTAQADFRTKSGDIVPYRFDGTTLTDSQGEVDRMCGFGQDISARIEREQELKEEQEFITQVINTIPDIFYVVDSDGTMSRWNQRVVEVTGYSDAEIAEMEPVEFFAEDEYDRIGDAIEEVLTTGQATVEADIVTRDGERLPYELTGGRLQDSEGTILGLVGIGRDITERKEYEQRLERQNEQLERFASVVSHDLRNPLNIAEGRLELAREECESDHLDSVARAHERMDRLIDDLLTLAREGERVSEMEAVALAGLTEQCWRNVATGEARIVTETDRKIRADRSRVQQLIENLMRNAVEHGGDDVTITVGELADGFYLEDTGPGIPEGERAEVFDAGYSTTSEGTGFGLSIVKQVADAHGWEIRITDGSEGGARFEVIGVEFAENTV